MDFEDNVRASFEKVREDIKILQEELFMLKKELETLRLEIKESIKPNFMNRSSTGNEGVPADQHTDTPLFNTPLFPVDDSSSMHSNTYLETPADIPTHLQQIDQKLQQMTPEIRQMERKITPEMVERILRDQGIETRTPPKEEKRDPLADLTDMMDTLKSDLKKKFKSLTKQEFYIFSVLYTVEKSQDSVTYQDIAVKTGLTSSSIRDYIQRIIRKGIPLAKEKLNNKVTLLKIPKELRNLATLDNLMRIRNDIPDESLDHFSAKK